MINQQQLEKAKPRFIRNAHQSNPSLKHMVFTKINNRSVSPNGLIEIGYAHDESEHWQGGGMLIWMLLFFYNVIRICFAPRVIRCRPFPDDKTISTMPSRASELHKFLTRFAKVPSYDVYERKE